MHRLQKDCNPTQLQHPMQCPYCNKRWSHPKFALQQSWDDSLASNSCNTRNWAKIPERTVLNIWVSILLTIYVFSGNCICFFIDLDKDKILDMIYLIKSLRCSLIKIWLLSNKDKIKSICIKWQYMWYDEDKIRYILSYYQFTISCRFMAC